MCLALHCQLISKKNCDDNKKIKGNISYKAMEHLKKLKLENNTQLRIQKNLILQNSHYKTNCKNKSDFKDF